MYWNEEPSFAFNNKELCLILDLMDEGKTRVVFVTHMRPEDFKKHLEEEVASMHDTTGKYSSRLSLIASSMNASVFCKHKRTHPTGTGS